MEKNTGFSSSNCVATYFLLLFKKTQTNKQYILPNGVIFRGEGTRCWVGSAAGGRTAGVEHFAGRQAAGKGSPGKQ